MKVNSHFFLSLIFLFCVFCICQAIESPQFTVVHSESDFEIRLYRESSWMSASVRGISFERATRQGFHRASRDNFYPPLSVVYSSISMLGAHNLENLDHQDLLGYQIIPLNSSPRTVYVVLRLFQYIQGANLNSSRIAMTAPVLTSIVPGEGPLHSYAYYIQLYLPVKFQAVPPLPLPELNLHPHKWASQCVAVRKFSGFARDSNVVKEAERLSISLSRSPWANLTSKGKYAYSIAQYNSPFRFIGRINEVWVDVDSESDGCQSSGLVESH